MWVPVKQMDNLTQVSANAQEDSSTAQIVIQSVLYSGKSVAYLGKITLVAKCKNVRHTLLVMV